MPAAAILYATVASADGSPAAALGCGESTLLDLLLDSLQRLGVEHTWVVTRPGWASPINEITNSRADVTVRSSASLGEDLQQLGDIATNLDQQLVICAADILTNHEVLAGLVADTRIVSGAVTARQPQDPGSLRVRTAGNRLVSAESTYHQVHDPDGSFLGMLTIGRRDRVALVEVAHRMAELAQIPESASWQQGTEVAEQDPIPFVLVGLLRSGVRMTNVLLGELFWTRPRSAQAAEVAEARMSGYDEDRVVLDAAVKNNDGFFTTYCVSPYSKFVARWFAQRGWRPNAVTMLSMVLGLATAVLFATGERWGLIAGAVALQLAFMLDCVDGQLSRYTRQFSNFGAWLDSVFDRAKEYVAYAGLAVGATVGFDTDVWALAVAALGLQTVRHTIDFSYPSARRRVQAEPAAVAFEVSSDRGPHEFPEPSVGDRGGAATDTSDESVTGTASGLATGVVRVSQALGSRSWTYWLKRIIVLPIGERFALISVTAAAFTPLVTFVALLVWGGLALLYQLTGRMMRSLP